MWHDCFAETQNGDFKNMLILFLTIEYDRKLDLKNTPISHTTNCNPCSERAVRHEHIVIISNVLLHEFLWE